MEQIPSNADNLNGKRKPEMSKEEYIKKLKSDNPVTGAISVAKPSIFKKVAGDFIKGDANSIKDSLINDFLIPMTKDAILNTISMFLYGDSRRPTGSYGAFKPASSGPKVSYRGYFTNGTNAAPPKQVEDKKFDYNEIEFQFKESAAKVYNNMVDIVDTYGIVSIADMYDLARNEEESMRGIPAPPYTYNDFGWKSLADVPNIIHVRSRNSNEMVWIIDMPKAIPIK